jgi:hypothetical protein
MYLDYPMLQIQKKINRWEIFGVTHAYTQIQNSNSSLIYSPT